MRRIRVLSFIAFYFLIFVVTFTAYFFSLIGLRRTVYSFTLDYLLHNPRLALQVAYNELVRSPFSLLGMMIGSLILALMTVSASRNPLERRKQT